MFGLFRKKKDQNTLPKLYDLEQNPLAEGDMVEALRYELGRARLVAEDGTYYYVSEETGKKIQFHLMIDASTERQKVKKIQP